jgi:putative Mn2+ efflux pump MntP
VRGGTDLNLVHWTAPDTWRTGHYLASATRSRSHSQMRWDHDSRGTERARRLPSGVVALVLVAMSVGLDNFAASTALGVAGVDRKLRLRVAAIFGIFEGLMPVVGLLLGRSLAHDLGSTAKPAAGALLGGAGVYVIVTGLIGDRGEETKDSELSVRHLILIGGALSIDNLIIGFALGAYHVDLVVAAITIAVISVALSLLGLEIGGRLGARLGRRSDLAGGAVLIIVGVSIGVGLL